jgi:hypothetical protein
VYIKCSVSLMFTMLQLGWEGLGVCGCTVEACCRKYVM